MKKCKDEKAVELKPLKDRMEALKTACLPDFAQKLFDKKDGDHKGKRGMHKGMGKLKEFIATLTEAQKTEANAKLESAACTDAVK